MRLIEFQVVCIFKYQGSSRNLPNLRRMIAGQITLLGNFPAQHPRKAGFTTCRN